MSAFSFKQFSLTLSCSLVLILIFVSSQRMGQAEPFHQIEEGLSQLSLQEKEIFEELFALSLALENLELENKRLADEMKHIMDETEELKGQITDLKQRNQKTAEGLAQVLKSYQRMGPASYMEIMLASRSPGDFLKRINLLKDLARNIRQLLRSIEASKAELISEREKHQVKLKELTQRQEQMEESLEKAILLRAKMKQYLLSLEKEKEYYQEQLANMQQTWGELKPFFASAIKKLAEIIEKGEIPQEGMKTRISLKGIYGSIKEEAFNAIIDGHPELPHVVFSFYQGQALLKLPTSHLELEGTFVIMGKSAIMFQVAKGTFFDLPLDESTLQELLEENKLVIDFKPLIGNNILRSIEIGDREVELLITPVFFPN